MSWNEQLVEPALRAIPNLYRGPGGAIAVLKDGELVGQHAWGYCDLDRRVRMTAQTPMPICSITKQMLCALLISLEQDPAPFLPSGHEFRERLVEELPKILHADFVRESGLTIEHLCNNASGIRDYWALSVLLGAHPEGKFSIADDAPPVLDKIRSLHFDAGSEYSYCNVNFHVVARIIERITHESLGNLLAQRIFTPAGMSTAVLCPDTAKHPGPCVGYEGNESVGFYGATNRMEWSGDAGVVASLEDMIAYERYFDKNWTEKTDWARLAADPGDYNDGNAASYRYGLGHGRLSGLRTIGHGGALRGYRLHRLYIPSERMSVVTMFNHQPDASGAAKKVASIILGLQAPAASSSVQPSDDWTGAFLDAATKLLVRVEIAPEGKIVIHYAGHPENVQVIDASHAESDGLIATIEHDLLVVERAYDNRTLRATRIDTSKAHAESPSNLSGEYHCAELESVFRCVDDGSSTYGAFDGCLGSGPEHLMRYVGEDVWTLSCPRGLDAPAPGDWTIVFTRNEQKSIIGCSIGCWLARKVEYRRQMQ